jgi:hypothetical protein
MTTYTTHKTPTWWDTTNDSAWERTKDAFKRDWDQTKHDMGGNEPDTNQTAGDTVKQAAGKEAIPPRHQPTYEEIEPAYRYGYGARSHYGTDYPEWDEDLEARLKQEWTTLEPSRKARWDVDREVIHHAWDFEE